ncbi:MAG: DUF349 domain-containing protein [Flavobacteriales bacterium]|nr:DUF349 domain-containing protein [Flavobacteriales bacterium]
MEVLNFLEEIKAYAENENALAVSRDVNELRSKFGDYILEEERKIQVSELEAQKTPETMGEVKVQAAQKTEELLQLKEEFYSIYTAYKEKKNAIIEEKNSSEAKNLSEKQSLIKRLQEVVTSEENIGSAFGALKEIQERWKEIGDIPRDKRNSIQGDYSKLLEDFFYNIKIYKELKDHDFHRNAQLKGKLIEELKQLNEVKSIKEVEAQLKVLQNNWDEIGPVPNEEWEKLKEGYWTEVKSVYNKINRFYDDRRAKLQENLNQKQALLEETKLLVAEKDGLDSVKSWDVVTKKIIATQATWKAVGFGPKKENDIIWKEFRAVCDEFFDAKKAFFGDIQQEFDKLADKKKLLVERAKKLSESQDWKETAGQLKQLQSQWKTIGHSGVKNEQKLWKEFRKACDGFFDARQKHFDAKDVANEENLKLKMAILSSIEKYKPSDDKAEVLAELKKFTAEFNSIGHVPIKQKDDVFNAYKKAMDGHYKSIKMGAEEQAQILFEAKIDMLKGGSNSSRQFEDMKFDLRKSIDAQQKEITQLENNLGFFANSKGANALKEEVEKKVAKAKEKIAGIKAQLKMIPNE